MKLNFLKFLRANIRKIELLKELMLVVIKFEEGYFTLAITVTGALSISSINQGAAVRSTIL